MRNPNGLKIHLARGAHLNLSNPPLYIWLWPSNPCSYLPFPKLLSTTLVALKPAASTVAAGMAHSIRDEQCSDEQRSYACLGAVARVGAVSCGCSRATTWKRKSVRLLFGSVCPRAGHPIPSSRHPGCGLSQRRRSGAHVTRSGSSLIALPC